MDKINPISSILIICLIMFEIVSFFVCGIKNDVAFGLRGVAVEQEF